MLRKAVYRSLRGNLQRKYTMAKLHIFADENVPESLMKNVSNQIRQIRPKPKRLDHFAEDEVKKFPQIIDYPKDYVVR